ncbi:MAG: type I phosphomannose isomerase catalytic subunit [Planctomycetota bacterium]
METCPLIFNPIFRPKVWGGRRLADLLGKNLPGTDAIGESWECADLTGGVSVVACGPAIGQTLHQLVTDWGPDLLGRTKTVDGRFPLLIKFLDAAQPLSIQVHPSDEAAAKMGLAHATKHEAWFVIHAEPGATIYRGLRPGVSLAQLRECLERAPRDVPSLLNQIPVKAGNQFYVPGGTVHALGAGVVVAEVQTPSDTTFRLYDWERTRPTDDAGLHIEKSLACVDSTIDIASFERRSHVSSIFTTVTRLVTCPSFIIEQVRFVEQIEQDIPYAEMVCWIVLEGRGEVIHGAGQREAFQRGDVVVLPAGLKKGRLKTLTPCTWLEVTVPTPSDLSGFRRPELDALQSSTPSGDSFVPLRVEAKEG